ncbi:alpha/beta hydrolase family protein [Paenibacillus sp. MBLB4367]|uniref:alpha/beta hydrolase family protein n=1 Tax=Paenibacillus sp. MBLB4367 TaxID=3384767 RepID=UPI003907ECEF
MTETLLKNGFRIELEEGLFLRGEVTAIEDRNAKPVLIVSHGFRGHKDWGFWPYVSDWFAERGFYTVRFDFSRIGAKSSGLNDKLVQESSTFGRELLDLGAVFSAITHDRLPLATLADPERIYLLGHSRSAASCLVFAAEHSEVRKIVAWNGGSVPQPDLNGGSSEAAVDDWVRNRERYDIPARLAALQFRLSSSKPAATQTGSSKRTGRSAIRRRIRRSFQSPAPIIRSAYPILMKALLRTSMSR